MTAAPRVFVGVHRCVPRPPQSWRPEHVAEAALGEAIDLASRARWRGPYEFPEGPSTHAFVVTDLRHLPGGEPYDRYRLDAAFPVATWERYASPHWPTLLWEITEGDLSAADSRATALVGSPYDPVELSAQLARGAIPELSAGLAHAWICSTMVCEVMHAAGGSVATLAAQIADGDAYPAEVARRLRYAEGWCVRRVNPVTLEAT